MTIEITDTEDFSRKLAYFFSAINKLERAGFEQSPDLFESLTEDFLSQFEATTMAHVEPELAGYIIILTHTGQIPADFQGVLYESDHKAQSAIDRFLSVRPYLSHSEYRVIKVTYYA